MRKILFLFVLSVSISCKNGASEYYTEAKSFYDNGNYPKAIEYFTKEINLKGGSDLAYYYRGRAKQSLGEFQNAILDFNMAIEINEELIASHVNRAVSLVRLKKYDIALQRLNEIIDHFINLQDENVASNLATAFNNRGLIKQFYLKDYDGAMTDFDKSLSIGVYPETYLPLMNRGRLYLIKGEYQKAIKDLDKSIELNDKNDLTYFIRGQVYFELEDFEKVISDTNEAIELEDNDWKYYNLRGTALVKLENYPESILSFDKAIELSNHAYAFNNRGYSKYKIGDLLGALKDCEKSLELNNQNSWNYYNLGLINYDLGKKEMACNYFDKALALGKKEAKKEIETKCL
ncbi:tetratricopeptide repeat protein [Flagellimonas sp.]|uniref:tetratricopeptide repeat protein n=1 Tax=Flagellimonas sp. TaxID=2058762 RepID=UPI003BB10441